MASLFQCPDCHATHSEPLFATYLLSVRCADCGLDREVLERRLFEPARFAAAA